MKPVRKQRYKTPFDVFKQATQFLKTAELIRAHADVKGPDRDVITPMMVLDAFAIELLLKCLLLIEKKDPKPTHLLNKLYKDLHPKTRRRIDEIWEIGPRKRLKAAEHKLQLPSDLGNALAKCSNAFDDLRYAHEIGKDPTFYLQEFPRVLIDVIAEIEPTWVVWYDQPTQPTFLAH